MPAADTEPPGPARASARYSESGACDDPATGARPHAISRLRFPAIVALLGPPTIRNRAMTEIASPCNKICVVDPHAALCVGCGRSLDDIAGWVRFSPEERTRIIAELPGRLQRLGRSTPP